MQLPERRFFRARASCLVFLFGALSSGCSGGGGAVPASAVQLATGCEAVPATSGMTAYSITFAGTLSSDGSTFTVGSGIWSKGSLTTEPSPSPEPIYHTPPPLPSLSPVYGGAPSSTAPPGIASPIATATNPAPTQASGYEYNGTYAVDSLSGTTTGCLQIETGIPPGDGTGVNPGPVYNTLGQGAVFGTAGAPWLMTTIASGTITSLNLSLSQANGTGSGVFSLDDGSHGTLALVSAKPSYFTLFSLQKELQAIK
jgi:hypothetical protein